PAPCRSRGPCPGRGRPGGHYGQRRAAAVQRAADPAGRGRRPDRHPPRVPRPPRAPRRRGLVRLRPAVPGPVARGCVAGGLPVARVPAAVVPAATTASNEPPPFYVPLALLAEADGRTDILRGFHDLHGFHDGEAWYAYDLPSQGQWRVVAWQAGYRWPPGLPDGVRLSRPAPPYAACGLLP